MKNTNLTMELLRKNFKNNFDLTNFAIQIARQYIKDHEGASLPLIISKIKEKVQEKKDS